MSGAGAAGGGVRATLRPESMRRRFEQLVAERADVKVARLILGDARVWEWIHSVAALQDPALRGMVPPMPPDDLRRIVSDYQPEMFLWTGYLDAECVLSAAERHLMPKKPVRILDFGAGCGRVTRFLWSAGGVAEVHGADVNGDHVAWCEKNLTFARWHRAKPLPPLGLPAGSLDCVYAISVATHLDPKAEAAWRAELARLLAPGGVAILTTHGYAVLDRVVESRDLQTWFRMPAAEASGIRSRLPREGFVFRRYDADVRDRANAGADYGISFADPDWIRRAWTDERLEVVELTPAGLRGWQDVVVLKRR